MARGAFKICLFFSRGAFNNSFSVPSYYLQIQLDPFLVPLKTFFEAFKRGELFLPSTIFLRRKASGANFSPLKHVSRRNFQIEFYGSKFGGQFPCLGCFHTTDDVWSGNLKFAQKTN